MATTTATVSISSSDLMSGNPLSINATSTVMKTGLTTGMELMDMIKKVIKQLIKVYIQVLQLMKLIGIHG